MNWLSGKWWERKCVLRFPNSPKLLPPHLVASQFNRKGVSTAMCTHVCVWAHTHTHYQQKRRWDTPMGNYGRASCLLFQLFSSLLPFCCFIQAKPSCCQDWGREALSLNWTTFSSCSERSYHIKHSQLILGGFLNIVIDAVIINVRKRSVFWR